MAEIIIPQEGEYIVIDSQRATALRAVGFLAQNSDLGGTRSIKFSDEILLYLADYRLGDSFSLLWLCQHLEELKKRGDPDSLIVAGYIENKVAEYRKK